MNVGDTAYFTYGGHFRSFEILEINGPILGSGGYFTLTVRDNTTGIKFCKYNTPDVMIVPRGAGSINLHTGI